MEGYRHLNVLVSGKTHNVLKKVSYKLHKHVSEIVRQGINLVLSKECKLSEEDTGSRCFGEDKYRD